MSRQVTTAQLWETIRTAGLASADECRKWAKGVSDALGKSVAADPEQLVASLVKFGYLTPYQGNVLYESLPHPLLLEGVRIEKSLQDKLGEFWYEGRILPPTGERTKLGTGERLWVAALSMETMSSPLVREWPPSAAWAEQHSRINSPQLDVWRTSGATLQHLFATVEPWSSKSLATELASGPLHIEQALRMIHDVSSGLQTIHEAGLVHGQLSLECILIEPNGSFRLRRDPLFPPRSPYQGTTPSLIPHPHSLLMVAAPELALPDSLPSIQSDLYALGCIWYRSITGAWPVEPAVGSSPVTWGALHARIPIQAPRTLPDIAGKCLLHLLAKDPSTRFTSANNLLQALSTTEKTASNENPSVAVDAPSVAPVVREPSAAYVANSPPTSSVDKPVDEPTKTKLPKTDQRPPTPEKSSVKGTSSEKSISAITPPEKPTTPKPVKEKPAAPQPPTKDVVAKGPQVDTPGRDAPKANTPKANEPKVDLPKVDDAIVEKMASEIRDKKGRVGQRNLYRPMGPKEPIGAPVDQGIVPTSAQPIVHDSELASETPPPSPQTSLPNDQVAPSEKSSPTPGSPGALASESTLGDHRDIGSPETGAKPRRRKKKRPVPHGKKGIANPKAKGKKGRPIWIMPALIAGSFILLLGMLLILRNRAPSVVTIENSPSKSKDNSATKPRDPKKDIASADTPVSDPFAERFEIRADDGNVPWAPPTVGSPCSTELLPMGIESLAYISSRVWQHQGPISPMLAWWNSLASEPRAKWSPEISAPTDSIDQVAIAWYPGKEPSTSRYAVRFTFKEPKKVLDVINTSDWSAKTFSGGSSATQASMWIRKESGSLEAMLCDDLTASPSSITKHVTFGPTDLLETILATKETPFVMRRQLDMLRQASDASSDLTLLVAPSFLYGDGKEILGPDSPRLLGLLSQLVDDKVQAFMLRAQWDKDWYLEWRSLGNDLQAATRNAANVKSQIEAASNQLEAALVNQPADPYWRAIANRFPQMLRALVKWMRTGAEDGQVIVNAYLPQEAVSNLVIGSWMAAQRDWNAVASTPKNNKPATPSKTIEQWLETPISLRIEQDSLENLLQAIATELKESSNSPNEPIPMAINGPAFQKDGITRNQQVRNFEYTSTPIRQVLTALARKANPVTTVEAPNEKDQKVVWVILDDPSTPTKKKLEFTTRAWTDSNQASLPTEFVLPKN